MKLDITQILNGKENVLETPLSMDPNISGLRDYLPEDTKLTAGVGGYVKVRHCGEYISVTVTPEIEITVPCARCLSPVKCAVAPTFERIIPAGGSFADEDELCDEEDILTVVEGHVDLTEHICEELALEIPDYVLCSDDCPGLCPKCGKNLKDGDCGCKNERQIDPRMRIFEKLLKDDE